MLNVIKQLIEKNVWDWYVNKTNKWKTDHTGPNLVLKVR